MSRLILVLIWHCAVIWKMLFRCPLSWTTVCCANHLKRRCQRWSTGAFWSGSMILPGFWPCLEAGQVDICLSARWRRGSTRTLWGGSTLGGSTVGGSTVGGGTLSGGFGLRTEVSEVNIGPSAINDWSLVHAGSLGAFLCGHGNLIKKGKDQSHVGEQKLYCLPHSAWSHPNCV